MGRRSLSLSCGTRVFLLFLPCCYRSRKGRRVEVLFRACSALFLACFWPLFTRRKRDRKTERQTDRKQHSFTTHALHFDSFSHLPCRINRWPSRCLPKYAPLPSSFKSQTFKRDIKEKKIAAVVGKHSFTRPDEILWIVFRTDLQVRITECPQTVFNKASYYRNTDVHGWTRWPFIRLETKSCRILPLTYTTKYGMT